MQQSPNHLKSPLTTNTQIDIVIPVYGAIPFLKECLDSIPKAVGDLTYSLYVIEDASPQQDAVKKFISEYSGEAKITKVVYSPTNRGYLGNCNFGAKLGSSPFILILTTDIVLKENCIALLHKELVADSIFGLAGAKLVFPPDCKYGPAGTIQHAGLDMNINADVVHTFIGWSADNPRVNVKEEVFALTGALILTRRSLWRQLNGFDEQYGKGTYEDVDYAIRARIAGQKSLYVPEAVATHHVNGSEVGFAISQNKQIFKFKQQANFLWTDWRRL
jgi:GT2 family glycosyltransferase